MAEVALILGILGSAYVASNHKNGDAMKEGYRNSSANRSRFLPNTDIPTTNYPIIQPTTGSNVNEYKNANAATDRYYARGVDFDKMSAGVAGGVGGVGTLNLPPAPAPVTNPLPPSFFVFFCICLFIKWHKANT